VPDESPLDLSEASVPLPALSVMAVASQARARVLGEGAGLRRRQLLGTDHVEQLLVQRRITGRSYDVGAVASYWSTNSDQVIQLAGEVMLRYAVTKG
jgi:hypothetical protein